MNNKWKKYKLGELGEIVGGATPSTNVEEYYGGDIPWITPKDLSQISGRYIDKGERGLTAPGLKSCSAKMLPKGSILFSSRAPVGYVAIANVELCTNQGFKSIIPNELVDSSFLFYLLHYNKRKIENHASGTTFKEVSGAVMRNIEVKIPQKNEQRIIAALLSSFDNKIELNNEINANLEQQAQAIFKSWFIDFEPFKDGEFVESELGMIPKEFSIGVMNKLIVETIGGDWGKDEPSGNNTNEVLCIRGADIPEVTKGNSGKMPTRYIIDKNIATKQLIANDLVVEISGGSPTQSTGRVALITEHLLERYNKPIICTNFCRALKPKAEASFYLFYLWQYLYQQGIMFSYENGTTGIKNLDINGLIYSELIAIPPKQHLTVFNRLINHISKIIFNIGLENERLSEIRDTLLPKLMSGEIDV